MRLSPGAVPGDVSQSNFFLTSATPIVLGSLLSASQLASIRATVSGTFPTAAAILSKGSLVSDGQGGFTDAWVTSANTKCRVLSQQTQSEIVVGGEIQSTVLYTIYLPYDTVISAANRLLIGGVTYQVQGRKAGMSQIAQVVVDAQRID